MLKSKVIPITETRLVCENKKVTQRTIRIFINEQVTDDPTNTLLSQLVLYSSGTQLHGTYNLMTLVVLQVLESLLHPEILVASIKLLKVTLQFNQLLTFTRRKTQLKNGEGRVGQAITKQAQRLTKQTARWAPYSYYKFKLIQQLSFYVPLYQTETFDLNSDLYYYIKLYDAYIIIFSIGITGYYLIM